MNRRGAVVLGIVLLLLPLLAAPVASHWDAPGAPGLRQSVHVVSVTPTRLTASQWTGEGANLEYELKFSVGAWPGHTVTPYKERWYFNVHNANANRLGPSPSDPNTGRELPPLYAPDFGTMYVDSNPGHDGWTEPDRNPRAPFEVPSDRRRIFSHIECTPKATGIEIRVEGNELEPAYEQTVQAIGLGVVTGGVGLVIEGAALGILGFGVAFGLDTLVEWISNLNADDPLGEGRIILPADGRATLSLTDEGGFFGSGGGVDIVFETVTTPINRIQRECQPVVIGEGVGTAGAARSAFTPGPAYPAAQSSAFSGLSSGLRAATALADNPPRTWPDDRAQAVRDLVTGGFTGTGELLAARGIEQRGASQAVIDGFVAAREKTGAEALRGFRTAALAADGGSAKLSPSLIALPPIVPVVPDRNAVFLVAGYGGPMQDLQVRGPIATEVTSVGDRIWRVETQGELQVGRTYGFTAQLGNLQEPITVRVLQPAEEVDLDTPAARMAERLQPSVKAWNAAVTAGDVPRSVWSKLAPESLLLVQRSEGGTAKIALVFDGSGRVKEVVPDKVPERARSTLLTHEPTFHAIMDSKRQGAALSDAVADGRVQITSEDGSFTLVKWLARAKTRLAPTEAIMVGIPYQSGLRMIQQPDGNYIVVGPGGERIGGLLSHSVALQLTLPQNAAYALSRSAGLMPLGGGTR